MAGLGNVRRRPELKLKPLSAAPPTASRDIWRLFDQREDVTREFHELEGGKWVQKA